VVAALTHDYERVGDGAPLSFSRLCGGRSHAWRRADRRVARRVHGPWHGKHDPGVGLAHPIRRRSGSEWAATPMNGRIRTKLGMVASAARAGCRSAARLRELCHGIPHPKNMILASATPGGEASLPADVTEQRLDKRGVGGIGSPKSGEWRSPDDISEAAPAESVDAFGVEHACLQPAASAPWACVREDLRRRTARHRVPTAVG